MNKKSIKIGLYSLLLIVLQSCESTKSVTQNKDTSSVPSENPMRNIIFQQPAPFESILAKAKAQNKPVFLDFSATWCMPCKLMEKNVFTDETVAQYFNQHFICYKADADTDPNGNIMNLNYDVKSYPAMLFLEANGNEIIREMGTVGKDRLLELARSARK